MSSNISIPKRKTYIAFLALGDGFGGLPTVLTFPFFFDTELSKSCPTSCNSLMVTLATWTLPSSVSLSTLKPSVELGFLLGLSSKY